MDATLETNEPTVAAESAPPSEENATPGSVVDVVAQETSTPVPEEEKNATATTSKGSASPPRRPLTRSQTGTVPKRRARDDSDHIVETKKRTSAPRKKQKTSSSSSTDSAPAPTQDASSTPSPSDSAPSPTREASLAASTSSAGGVAPSAPANGQQLTFYHAASTFGEGQQLQADLSRLPRSRATLPTPIPNLTKKSRGRRVPTQDTALNDPERKDHRLYVCTVDGCGKCFHRGEHLKRHIRSIHTHEKPFKCTFPLCQKYFNRHDNLLQHLKVHREPVPKDAADVEDHVKQPVSAPPPQRQSAPSQSSSSTSPPASYHHRRRSYSPIRMPEPESPIAPQVPRTIYNAFPMGTMGPMSGPTYPSYPSSIAFSQATNSISLLADMAISSLRTEIPQSPLDARTSALRSNPY
ncbi:hypothetical protein CVT26_006226 [Gymnopilus dilepis]|uniref:C2H2-type domain-containing protein n=1 Tax=Gymnopilus dilepis TaxID=231916 RepID=A0A409WYV8_9AGAR|nr:hypothetical protein CVT26_006226 [Gymnopilus dilepis]